MRPQRRDMRPRADDWWYEPSYAPTGPGTVHDLGPSEGPEGKPVVLWVPDIDARHKWREHYAYPEQLTSKDKKRMGF